jgi:spore cortex biosynthesis protein YabQ
MPVRAIDAGIYRELGIFCSFFLTGIFLGASYDLLRLLRGLIPHSDLMVNLEDLLYWITMSLVVFVRLYDRTDGQLRGYVFLGLLAGLGAYGATFARICTPPLIRVSRRIRNRLLAPLGKVCGYLGKKQQKVHMVCGKLRKSRKKRLKKLKHMVKMGVSKL